MADLLDNLTPNQLRRTLRQRRASLSRQQQNEAASKLARNARGFAPLLNARHIASYQAFQGEISTTELTGQLHCQSLLLPKITSFLHASMRFYPASQRKLKNRYGIWEPAGDGAPADLRQTDVVLLPLVAFDRHGNRMGMGAGFYDRALSFRLNQKTRKRPLLIGLAHALQEVNELSRQPWDVPLDVILTDHELIQC